MRTKYDDYSEYIDDVRRPFCTIVVPGHEAKCRRRVRKERFVITRDGSGYVKRSFPNDTSR